MKKIIITLATLAFFGAFFSACTEKEKDPETVDLKAPVISAQMNGEVVVVSWKAVTGATSYTVECKKSTESAFTVAGVAAYSPMQVKDLEYGNTYEFRAKATCGESESAYSNVVSVEVAKFLPKPVVKLTAGISFIEVDWDAVEGAESYRLEHKASIGSEWSVDYTGDGSDNSRHVKLSELESGVSYDVRVGAIAEGYSITYSDIASAATTEAPSTIISNAEQLVAWLGSINSANMDIAALANDIDMEGKSLTASASGFSGILDGQGFSIKNLVCSVPLFAENSGRIRNLNFDSSCSFTPASSVFGALVALDKGGSYNSVSSAASITYTATADITENLAIGGLVGASDSKDIAVSFNGCSNSGAITIDAAGHTHYAVALGGIIGYSIWPKFELCTNSGPISLTALYGDPFHQWSYAVFANDYQDGNICVGGIAGKVWDVSDEYEGTFTKCENLAGGDIRVTHTAINKLADSSVDDEGGVKVGGILGQGNGTMNRCHNRATINVSVRSDNGSKPNKRNCILHVGGVVGLSFRGNTQESCSNRAAINVAYDGSWAEQNRDISAIGGVVGKQGYNKPMAKTYFCTNHGPMTVTGNGTMHVGGIAGCMGYQRGNKVYAEAPINVHIRNGYVGGLLGFADGNSAYQHIKSSWCEADITARSTETSRYNISTGGLVGLYAFGQSGSNPTLVWVDDEGPCHYKGNISTPGQFKTGMAIGWINIKDKIHVYGSQEHPIELSGTLEREELEKTTITSANVFSGHYMSEEGYGFTDGNLAIGSIKYNTEVTIWCTCAGESHTYDAIFIGDSITANWVKSDKGHPEFFIDHNFLGLGYPGKTTATLKELFQTAVLEKSTKQVVISGGTNDIAQNDGVYVSNEEILANIASMAADAAARGIRVVLTSVTPSTGFSWASSISHPETTIVELNTLIKALAEEKGYGYADYHSALVDEKGGIPEAYSSDGTHPNKAGYTIMEGIILPILQSAE